MTPYGAQGSAKPPIQKNINRVLRVPENAAVYKQQRKDSASRAVPEQTGYEIDSQTTLPPSRGEPNKGSIPVGRSSKLKKQQQMLNKGKIYLRDANHKSV